jgi:tetratricopeptide (TPR) repeat protein
LLEAEMHLGLRDLAFAHAGAALRADEEGEPRPLLLRLFSGRRGEAEGVWELLRSAPKAGPPPDTLRRVRAFLEGKAPAREVQALAEAAGKARALDGSKPEHLLLHAGWVALACGQPKTARALYAEAGTAEAHLRLGDLLAGVNGWAGAAEHYERAHSLAAAARARGPGRPGCSAELVLFLSGHALARAGKAAEGARRMERAQWLPLGQTRARHELARALRQRGHREAARRAHDLLRRLGEPGLHEGESLYTADGWRAGAAEAARRGKYLEAADGYEQAMLRCLRHDVSFRDPAAHVTVPALVHRLRARGLLQAGKVDEALRQAALAEVALPGAIELPLALVPELERRGRTKEAATLFGRALAAQQKVLRAYPRCARAHNAVAWLSVCCRRDFDSALRHARRSVELAPDSPFYHDTLAEVCFQKGLKKEAVAAQKKAVALAPGNGYFRKQLRRMEAGDVKAPRPAEDGE